MVFIRVNACLLRAGSIPMSTFLIILLKSGTKIQKLMNEMIASAQLMKDLESGGIGGLQMSSPLFKPTELPTR